MFDQFKAMGAVAGLLKNTDRLREAGERVKARLESVRTEGASGGGAVRVRATGRLRIESIEVSPAIGAALAGTDDATRNDAHTLITLAINEALQRAEAQARDEVARELDELGLGDLAGMGGPGGLAGLLGGA